jgi:hypothetical protein
MAGAVDLETTILSKLGPYRMETRTPCTFGTFKSALGTFGTLRHPWHPWAPLAFLGTYMIVSRARLRDLRGAAGVR